MKLQAISIKNYRSFDNISIRLGECSFVVGANNAGKSNLLDAIRCFFGSIPFDPVRDFRKKRGNRQSREEDVSIAATFANVATSSIPSELRTFLSKDGQISIRRVFCPNAAPSTGRYEICPNDGSEKERKALRTLPACFHASISYVPSMSKPSEEMRLTGPSALRSLIGDIFGAAFETSNLCKAINRAVRKLEKREAVTGDMALSSLKRLESVINRGLKEWGASFSVSPRPVSGADIVKSLLEVRIRDFETSSDTDLSSFGSGFQRTLLFQIVKVGAEDLKTIENGFRLLLFEEPEAFLHPDQQAELARNLRRLAAIGYQVVCTTHSPFFVERMMDNIPGIIRLERHAGISSAYQMSQDEWAALCDSNVAYPDYLKIRQRDLTLGLDAFRYALWLNGSRAPVFFARRVLLVEGATETALFSALLDDGRLRLPPGTVIIECLGKYNFHRFMALLTRFGIPFAAVYDDDSLKTDANKRNEQQRWNRFLEETAKKFGAKALPLKGDLEDILEIQKPKGRPDSKPFHILSEYKKGNCRNIDALCLSIKNLFTNDCRAN